MGIARPKGARSRLWRKLPSTSVEMMGLEPMSKFNPQKIFYKFSLFVFEQFIKYKINKTLKTPL